MLDNSPLPDVFYKYFLLGCGLSFNSLDIIFCRGEFFNEFLLMNYLFHRLCLGVKGRFFTVGVLKFFIYSRLLFCHICGLQISSPSL